jgi:hypothetical protein
MSREGGFASGVTSRSTIKRLIRRVVATFKPEIRIPACHASEPALSAENWGHNSNFSHFYRLTDRHCGQAEIPGPDLECGFEVYTQQLRNPIMTVLHSGNVAGRNNFKIRIFQLFKQENIARRRACVTSRWKIICFVLSFGF